MKYLFDHWKNYMKMSRKKENRIHLWKRTKKVTVRFTFYIFQEFEILKARDNELHLLRDGKLKAAHKNRSKKLLRASKKEAFQK